MIKQTTNWQELRNSYPITKKGAYLANAAISGMHQKTNQAIKDWADFQTEWAAIKDPEYSEGLEQALENIASFLHVESSDIAIGPNSSTNMNTIALCLKNKTNKKHIISPADEFPSSTLAWHHHGFDVSRVPSINGKIRIQDLLDQITEDTAAVVTSAVQFLTGFRIDLIELGKKLEALNIPLIVNATQAIGAFDIPTKEAKISALTASCHKWIGAGLSQAILMISPEFRSGVSWPAMGWASVEDAWLLSNEKQVPREDTSSLILGSLPVCALAGIDTAITIAKEIGLNNISERILFLAKELEKGLRTLPIKINTYCENDKNRTGAINFQPINTNINIDELIAKLHQENIFINGRRGTLRASAHFYNNEKDIDLLINALKKHLSDQ